MFRLNMPVKTADSSELFAAVLTGRGSGVYFVVVSQGAGRGEDLPPVFSTLIGPELTLL